MYLRGVSFLTTLDIYKTYFKGRRIMHWVCKVYAKRIQVDCDLVHYSFWRSYYVFTPRVLLPKSFPIFIVDELKNFIANNLFKLVELVTYWDSCIIG